MKPTDLKTANADRQLNGSLVSAGSKSWQSGQRGVHTVGGSGRILVVAGTQSLCRQISQILATDGLEVITTTSGTDAILQYHRRACDVVLTDDSLGDMPGIEVLKAVKGMDDEAQVMLMTSYASIETVLEALRAGAYDYLIAPADYPGPLLSAVKGALRRVDTLRQHRQSIEQLRIKMQVMEEDNARLKRMAISDPLTGLFNRRYFQECLSAEIDRCKRYPSIFTLLFMDLDYFKKYNDINGHVAGDVLLLSLSQMLLKMFRKTDTLARYGGDEFVAILPQTDTDQALELGEKITRQVATIPFKGMSGMPGGRISISIGCAAFPHDGVTSEALLNLADQSLYKSKTARSGQMV